MVIGVASGDVVATRATSEGKGESRDNDHGGGGCGEEGGSTKEGPLAQPQTALVGWLLARVHYSLPVSGGLSFYLLSRLAARNQTVECILRCTFMLPDAGVRYCTSGTK